MTNATLQRNLAVFDENKLLILKRLFNCKHNDVCGCDLIETLNIPKNLVSYHIKKLEDLGYVQEFKCGRKKNYVIKEDKRAKVESILFITELI